MFGNFTVQEQNASFYSAIWSEYSRWQTDHRVKAIFNEIFAAEFKRAFRDKTPLSIRLVNIDHFKMINDTFGHPFGNVCLASAAGAVPDASDSPASLLKAADLLLCRAKKKGRNRIESSIE